MPHRCSSLPLIAFLGALETPTSQSLRGPVSSRPGSSDRSDFHEFATDNRQLVAQRLLRPGVGGFLVPLMFLRYRCSLVRGCGAAVTDRVDTTECGADPTGCALNQPMEPNSKYPEPNSSRATARSISVIGRRGQGREPVEAPPSASFRH